MKNSGDYTLGEIIEVLSHNFENHEKRMVEKSELSRLSTTQIHYLDSICHLENPSLSELAEERKVSKPTATIAVDKLVSLGYIRKVQSDADRRVMHLHLTAKGHKISDLHDTIHFGFAERLQKNLTNNEAKDLIALLQKALMI